MEKQDNKKKAQTIPIVCKDMELYVLLVGVQTGMTGWED